MSKENFEEFMEQVAGSDELQSKIGEEMDYLALVALGAECGFEFTAEDLLSSAMESINKLTLSWEIDEASYPSKLIKIDLTSVSIPEYEKLIFSELNYDPHRFELKPRTDISGQETILEGYMGHIRFEKNT